ncbi:PRPF19 family protein [Megaselia abdita]
MTTDDLIEIKTPPIVKPKPPSATSIPATLKTMQDEWDALMLHSFTQKQQLQTARQELSHSLYQHDSACRVIARLNKEISQVREALATLKPQSGTTSIPQPAIASEAGGLATQPIEQAGMSAEVIEKLQDKATVLTQERKKRGRTVPEELVTQDQLKGFMTTASHPRVLKRLMIVAKENS